MTTNNTISSNVYNETLETHRFLSMPSFSAFSQFTS